MPLARAGGVDLFYAVRPGAGPSIILVHGAGGSHLTWPPALRHLRHAAVYAIDLPGHGRASGEGRDRIVEYAADLVGLIDALGVDQVVLVGHSMGGAVVQETALMVPERVVGLMLLGTGARLRVSETLLAGLPEDFERTVDLITRWSWGPAADDEMVARGRDLMLRGDPHVLLCDLLACDRFDARGRAPGIAAPTRVVTGAEDRMTPPRLGRSLTELIPGARFHLLPGAGHMVMVEQPEAVARILVDLLEQVG
jgi:pimeloyl-ACP methyl ester carboxylesterase